MKQTMMKSLLSLVLVAVLCVGAILPVFAATSECPAQHDTTNCTYETVSVVEAKCGNQGYTVYKCTACDTKFAGDFVAAPSTHDWIIDVEKVDATCTTDGKTEGKHCSKCDEVVKSEPVKASHSFGSWEIDGADCSTATKEKRTCSVCDATETRDREGALGEHDWELDKETFVAPTCKTEGKATYNCTKCDATKTGKVTAVGNTDAHVWGNAPVEIVTESTCAVKGKGIYKCEACGTTETRELELSTTHAATKDLVATAAKPATCTTPGNKAGNKCPICDQFIDANGAVDESAIIPAKGHTMGSNYEEQGELTCTTAKIYVFTCTVCGEKATQIIGPAGHTFVTDDVVSTDPTCTDWGYTFKACTKCGYSETEMLEPLNHSKKVKYEGNDPTYKPQTTATCGSYAYYYEYCELCGVNPDGSFNFDNFVKVEIKTGTLPEHKWSDADDNKNNDTKTVASTCAVKGYTYNYCLVCDAEKAGSQKELPLVDHAKESPIYATCTTRVVTTIANCIDGTAGKMFVECTNCKLELKEITIPAEHDYALDTTHPEYDEPKCADQATDTAGGVLVYVCQYVHVDPKTGDRTPCTDYYTEKVDATEHSWEEYGTGDAKKNYQKVEATCQDAAHNLYTCTRCDLTFKDYAPYKDDEVKTSSKNYHVNSHWDSTATEDLEGNPLAVPGYYKVCTKEGGKALQVWLCDDCDNGFYLEAGHAWDETDWVNGKPADYVAATCTQTGISGTYTCTLCEYVEVSVVTDKIAHALGDVAKKDPANCADNGWAAYKKCANCDYTEGYKEIKPHTDKITLVADAKAPTCQETGIKEAYYKCSVCNKFLTATVIETPGDNNSKIITYSNITYRDDAWVKANVAAKADHTPADGVTHFLSATADCTNFGYNATDCKWCDYVITTDYVPATGHDFAATGSYVDGITEPTCEKSVMMSYVCQNSNCTETKTEVVEGKEATGHITADPDGDGPLTGTVIYNSCLDTHEDRVCVNEHCDFANTDPAKNNVVPNGDAAHKYTKTSYAATCYEYAYDFYLCSVCGDHYAEYDETQPKPDHVMTDWAIIPVTQGNPTHQERHCVNVDYCGVKEKRSIQTLYMEYDVVNGVVAGADFVNSGIVELQISTSATDLLIHGLGIVINYNNDVLSYMDAEVVSKAFLEVHAAGNDGDAVGETPKAANGVLRVNAYASVPGTDIANITLNGEEVLITVRFRVNADVAKDTTANFNIDLAGSSATTKDGEAVNVVWHDTDDDATTDDTIIGTLTTKALGDVVKLNSGATITMMDATEMLRIITGESKTEYMAEADIDKDGKITAADFAAMQKYLVSGDYEELVMNGVDAE